MVPTQSHNRHGFVTEFDNYIGRFTTNDYIATDAGCEKLHTLVIELEKKISGT